MGSGDLQNGTALAARYTTVVVTINYRLGAFGLLPMYDAAAAGNTTGKPHTARRYVLHLRPAQISTVPPGDRSFESAIVTEEERGRNTRKGSTN